MSEELLFPGDFIANAEEFLPGEGTYVEDGKIFSSVTGVADKNLDQREVSVGCKGCKLPVLQHSGLEVIGIVARTSEKAGFVDLMPLEDATHRYFPIPASTVLRVNNIRRGFVKSLAEEFKIGDVVRVKILEADPENVVVSTDGPNLGVIKAYCVKCRTPLDKDAKGLTCPECGWRDHRHLAADYREAKV
ncbi:exosome complex RNA-binding protein Csl4 [archaeon]